MDVVVAEALEAAVVVVDEEEASEVVVEAAAGVDLVEIVVVDEEAGEVVEVDEEEVSWHRNDVALFLAVFMKKLLEFVLLCNDDFLDDESE